MFAPQCGQGFIQSPSRSLEPRTASLCLRGDMSSSRIILGVDPSVACCGLGAIERDTRKIILLETVRTTTEHTDAARFQYIYRRICAAIRSSRAQAVAVEEQRRVQAGAHGRGEVNSDNSKTLVVVGLAMAAAWAHGFPAFFVTTQRSRIALLGNGKGNAKKADVKRAVDRMAGGAFGVFSTDAAEAIAIACGVSQLELAQALLPDRLHEPHQNVGRNIVGALPSFIPERTFSNR